MSHPTDDSGRPTVPEVPQAVAEQPVAEQPAAKSGKSPIVFAILAVIFLLAAGAMTALYVIDMRAAEKTIAGHKAQVASLQRDVTSKNDQVAKVTADLDKANKDLTAAKADAEKNAACSQSVKDFFAALRANDDARGEAAVLAMASSCGASLN